MKKFIFCRVSGCQKNHPAERHFDLKRIKTCTKGPQDWPVAIDHITWHVKCKQNICKTVAMPPSRVLSATGHFIVPNGHKDLRATWPRPVVSHLLPEASTPSGIATKRCQPSVLSKQLLEYRSETLPFK